MPQEMGPLNSDSRRRVHLEVSLDEGVTSESQGDGLVKTVIIAPR
jgi:predicted RNA-binding protein Jag